VRCAVTEAEERLARLMTEVRRHEHHAREYGEMAARHRRLLKLVCAEIRRHCLQSGLAIPDDLPPEPLD
jgi:hypothetical protein